MMTSTSRSTSTHAALREVAAAATEAAAEAAQRDQERYRAYLASAAWRENPARLAELASATYRCRLCCRTPPQVRLEVHHRTYRNLGRERLEDLTTLCATCHGVVTEMLSRRLTPPLPR